MAKQKQEPKMILEREYIVPLRRQWLKVPKHRRAKKAIRAIKEFMVKHMKIYDRDLRKIKLDSYLNNEIWYRGIKRPHHKIKVKAKKFDNDIVKVELVKLPEKIKFEKKRFERKKVEIENKTKKKPSPKEKANEESSESVKKETKEETKKGNKKENSKKETESKDKKSVKKNTKKNSENKDEAKNSKNKKGSDSRQSSNSIKKKG